MVPFGKRSDTVIDEAGGPTPHDDITVFEPQAAHRVRATLAAPQEDRGQAERNRNDRSRCIHLVTILMKTEFGARRIAIDQAGIRIIINEPGLCCGARGDVEVRSGHRWPWNSSLRVQAVIAITASVRYPTNTTAVSHCDRH